jgi:hypothetical protein
MGKGMCGGFFAKRKLKTPMKTRCASKVIVLFQETFVMPLKYVKHVQLELYKLGFQVSKLGLW